MSDTKTEMSEADLELSAWRETSEQNLRNAEFYRGICNEIAEALGEGAYTADDGSVYDSPLALKLPPLVRELTAVDWEAKARALWQIIDDIDTELDACKGDARAFMRATSERVKRRHEHMHSPDGHALVPTVKSCTSLTVSESTQPARDPEVG